MYAYDGAAGGLALGLLGGEEGWFADLMGNCAVWDALDFKSFSVDAIRYYKCSPGWFGVNSL